MVRLSFAVVLATTTAVLGKPIAAPEPTPAPDLKRATLDKRTETCTFSGSGGASSASVSQADCSTIILSALAVPSGVTLELTSLEEGTTVCTISSTLKRKQLILNQIIFEGETTFGFEEWSGPLVSIAGTDITVTGASGSYLNGNGADYWDGLGSDGGVTKPEFFWAHNMISSSINSVYILNSPVQVFSIDDSTDLTLTDITVDNTAGNTDDLAANTDGFDIASSTGITITGANIYNQDDCVAINSGSVSLKTLMLEIFTNLVKQGITFSNGVCSGGHGLSIGSVGGRDDNTVETVLFENSEIVSSQNGMEHFSSRPLL